MVLWWAVVAAGVLVYIGVAVELTRTHRDRRVATRWRLEDMGAGWRPRAALFACPLLMVVGSAKATSTDGGSYAVLFSAIALSIVGHTAVLWLHNRRFAATADRPSTHGRVPQRGSATSQPALSRQSQGQDEAGDE